MTVQLFPTITDYKQSDNDIIVTLFVTFYTKNPPQTILRGIFVEHRSS